MLAGCLDTNDPTGGGIAIRFDNQGATGAKAAHLDSVQVAVSGPTTSSTSCIASSGSTQIVCTINNLSAGSYSVSVTGYSGGAVSYRQNTSATVSDGSTATATVTAPSASPFLVSTLTVTSTSSTSATLVWKDSATNEDGFRIERCAGTCTASGTFSTASTAAANSITYTDVGLTSGTYSYRVCATAGTKCSAYSNIGTVTTGSGGGTIVLSPATVNFGALPGGASPAAQVVSVTNGGTGSLTGLTLGTITYVTGSGWLNATLSGTTAPATISLNATTGSLASGNYSATIAVSSTTASNSPQTVTVNFTVSATPIVALDQPTLSFAAGVAGSNPLSRPVLVTNGGTGSLTGLSVGTIAYAVGATGWLTTSLSATSAPAVLVVTSTTGSLAAGTYTATVPVSTSLNSITQNLAVSFTVASSALISLGSATASFAAAPGGSSPGAQNIAISNGGTGSLTGLTAGTITYGAGGSSWLAATVSSTTAPATLTLTPTTGTLSAGTYTATVPVTATGIGNSPQNVAVTLVVSSNPLFSVNPQTLSFAATPAGSNPTGQTISVTNGGTGSLSGIQFGGAGFGPGATAWLNTTISPTTAPSTVTFTPQTAGLAAGTYTAFPLLTSSAASNSPRVIPITFLVTSSPAIGLASSSASFSGNVGGSNPTAATINVTNAGGGSLTGLTAGTISYSAGGSNWLAASFSTGTAPATLTLTPSVGTLTAGTYTATVPITSSVAVNSPQNVTVTMTLTAVPLIALNPTSVAFAAQPSGGTPLSQTIAVTNPGASGLSGLAVGSITYSANGAGWLTAALSGTTAPASLTLTASTALAAGTYTATVPITASNAGNSPQSVSVTYVVSSSGLISFGQQNANFAAITGGVNPISQYISVVDAGGVTVTGMSVGTITYGAGASGWLVASLANNSATPTAPALLTLTPSTSSQAAGTYTASVPIAGTASNTPQNFPVTFTIAAAPLIAFQSPTATFVTATGLSPAAQSIGVRNDGAGTMSGLSVGTITYSAGATGWLGASLNTGTAPATLTLTPSTAAVPAGLYYAVVPVTTAQASNSPQSVSITLVVTANPAIALSAANVGFTGAAGGASPTPIGVSVTNGGGSTLSGLSIGTVAYGLGSSGWLGTSLNTTTAPATLTLTPTTGSLPAGVYYAAVPLSSNVAGSSPRTILVQFVVQGPPTLQLAPNSVTFNATANGASPATQVINVNNSGTGSITGLAVGTITYGAGATGWITTASVNSTVAPALLTLGVATGSLLAGTYTATVPITGSSSNSPQNVSVTFNVASPSGVDIAATAFSTTLTNGPASAGDMINASVSLVNQGTTAAGAFRIGFYFSSDATVNTSDNPSSIVCTYTSGLAAGATDTCSGLLAVPANLTPGTWFVAAVLDDQSALTESSKTNNTSTTTTITVPTSLITNGSFSSSSGGWVTSGNAYINTVGGSYQTTPGYGIFGTDAGFTGLNGASGTMYQDVTIPAGSTGVTLSFWYNITTAETGGANDLLTVAIRNTSNTVLLALPTLSNTNAVTNPGYGNYTQVTQSLASYVGQTIRIYFSETSNGSNPTVFRIDNVNVTKN